MRLFQGPENSAVWGFSYPQTSKRRIPGCVALPRCGSSMERGSRGGSGQGEGLWELEMWLFQGSENSGAWGFSCPQTSKRRIPSVQHCPGAAPPRNGTPVGGLGRARVPGSWKRGFSPTCLCSPLGFFSLPFCRRKIYGPNLIEVPVKSYARLLVEEVRARAAPLPKDRVVPGQILPRLRVPCWRGGERALGEGAGAEMRGGRADRAAEGTRPASQLSDRSIPREVAEVAERPLGAPAVSKAGEDGGHARSQPVHPQPQGRTVFSSA